MSVVLPAPLEPSSPIIPVGRSMVTSSRAAGLPRKSLVTWLMEMYTKRLPLSCSCGLGGGSGALPGPGLSPHLG